MKMVVQTVFIIDLYLFGAQGGSFQDRSVARIMTEYLE